MATASFYGPLTRDLYHQVYPWRQDPDVMYWGTGEPNMTTVIPEDNIRLTVPKASCRFDKVFPPRERLWKVGGNVKSRGEMALPRRFSTKSLSIITLCCSDHLATFARQFPNFRLESAHLRRDYDLYRVIGSYFSV